MKTTFFLLLSLVSYPIKTGYIVTHLTLMSHAPHVHSAISQFLKIFIDRRMSVVGGEGGRGGGKHGVVFMSGTRWGGGGGRARVVRA